MRVCPVCDQGDVIRARLKFNNRVAFICDDCEAMWFRSEDVGSERWTSFETYMRSQGINYQDDVERYGWDDDHEE